MRHLYRFFKPLSSCFALILCRIGAFILLYYFYACAGRSMFCAHFCSGLVSRGQLQIITVDSRCFREAPGNNEVKLGNYGDIGTGTHMQLRYNGVLVPVPSQSGIGTEVLLENQWSFGTGTSYGIGTILTSTGTNMLSLQDLRRISILVQRHARLLIPTSRSLMWIVFKPTLGQNWGGGGLVF